MLTMYVRDMQSQARCEIAHEPDGTIRRRCLSHSSSGTALPPWPTVTTYHRVHNGFVEIGAKNEGLDKVVWSPVIKIGATAGDRWEREIIKGMKEAYEVKGFKVQDVSDSISPAGEVLCAKVEITNSVAGMPGLTTKEEIIFGQGVGPVEHRSWRFEGGERKQNWSHVLVPTVNTD